MLIFLKWGMYIYIFIIGSLSFIMKRKHLLSILISLEFIVLVLYFFLLIILSMLNFEIYYCIFFLVFRVCEGALRISLLVSIIRTHGNDFFRRYAILQC